MTEFLVDKKDRRASLQDIYNKMIYQNKIYKVKKYKNNGNFDMHFTGKRIADKNIYDLNNNELSTLIQNLIGNDIKKKSNRNFETRSYEEQYRDYLRMGRINSYDDYDDYLDDEEEEEIRSRVYIKDKHKKIYDYLYDSTKYEALLFRGLEYLDEDELQVRLNGEEIESHSKAKRLVK